MTRRVLLTNESGLRLLGVIICGLGLVLFLFFAFLGVMEVRNQDFSSPFEAIAFLVRHVLIVPGIVPLAVSISILVFFRRSTEFVFGLFVVVPALIALHYVVMVVSAHAELTAVIGLVILEIIVALIVWSMKLSRTGLYKDPSG